MCGPSSGLTALNNTAKTAVASAQSEATSIFGALSSVFNNIVGGLQQIVTGGPSQAGYGAAELNATNAAAVQGGATMARNLGEAAGTSAAAVGGGNTATPGAIESSVLAAKTAAAQETAGAENQIVQADYAQGNKNYESAVGQEENLPNVFNPATSAEGQVNAAVNTNLSTQKAVDTSSNWWQPMVTAAIGGASSALTGGLMSSLGAPSSQSTMSTTGWANDMALGASTAPSEVTSTLPDQLPTPA